MSACVNDSFFFSLQVINKPEDPSGHMRLFLRSALSQTHNITFVDKIFSTVV
jgi:hypothetical protein